MKRREIQQKKKYTQFHSEPVQFPFIGNPPQIITTYITFLLPHRCRLRLRLMQEGKEICMWYEIACYTLLIFFLFNVNVLYREKATMLQKSLVATKCYLFIYLFRCEYERCHNSRKKFINIWISLLATWLAQHILNSS